MIWLFVIMAVLVVCFGGVLLFGAPYLPTLTPQVETALDLAELQPGETLLELGCGDGKVLIAAAKRGYKAVGYELNPFLALIAWLRTRRYKGRVRVVCGNFWTQDWPKSEAIFVFLLDKFMNKLDTKITQLPQPPRLLVSFAFEIPDKKPIKHQNGLFVYRYAKSG